VKTLQHYFHFRITLQEAEGNKQIMKQWKQTKSALDQQGFSTLTLSVCQ